MKSYRIGEIASVLNIKIDTIRYYEKIGLIPKPERKENEYRVYSEEYVEIIQFIILCKNNGFKLKEISEIMNLISSGDDNSQELKTVITNKIALIENKIEELILLKKQLNVVIENCDLKDCTIMDFLE